MSILLIFLFFLIFIFSINIILTKTPIYSILSLILAVIGLAVILFCLGFEFLPYLILMIYIGGVAILFLFVVMMINIDSYFKYTLINTKDLIYVLVFIKTLTLSFFLLSNSNHLKILGFTSIWIENFINYKQSDILIFSNSLYYCFSIYTILTALILFVGMVGSISICLSNKNLYLFSSFK